MQLIASQPALISNVALAVAVLHASDKREVFGSAAAIRKGVEELRHANRSGDARRLLLEIEVRPIDGAVSPVFLNNPGSSSATTDPGGCQTTGKSPECAPH